MIERHWYGPVCCWNNSPGGLSSCPLDAPDLEHVSLQDDLAVSDSEDEAVLELKNDPEKCLKSPMRDTTDITINSTVLGTSNNNMEHNSAETSNSSSSEDSDSDDSSSESNDSDSSSEASDEEISSKKWGLSNFVDESQRIYSPAFIPADAAKDSTQLNAETVKNSVLSNLNSTNGAPPNQDTFHQPVTETTSFLVPEVPVTAKSEILSPIPSPIHTQVGPRTPPSPPCPLKQELSEANKIDSEVLNSEVECKSLTNESSKSTNKSNLLSDKPPDNRDNSADKGNVQNEKCKKQLRSSKSKELNSEAESSTGISADESSNAKESSGTISEKDKITEKSTSSAVISATSEPHSENYPIKTRQRVSAATRRKSAINVSESSQTPEDVNSAIAKLKHPRACRKSTEKQNKKTTSSPNSIKQKLGEEPKRLMKQEAKDSTNVIEKIKTNPKPAANVTNSSKSTPIKTSTRSKGKASKTQPKQLLEEKKPEMKKKKKKFALKNFVQSPENEDTKPPNILSSFTPSPERSPIPECQKGSEAPADVTSESPTSSKPQSKSNSKNPIKVKKVEKLRRSVRCSERASNNAQADSSSNQQTTENKEIKKNSKSIGRAKSAENVSISIDPPVELLSPIPHDPLLPSQGSDSAIPVKIMVCIPLNMLSRYPGSSQHPEDSAAKEVSKSASTTEEANTQKKDTTAKSLKTAGKSMQQSKDKIKTETSIKYDKTNSTSVKAKNKKDVKVESESSVKIKSGSIVNKNIKVKDKTIVVDSDSKLPKKRKSESDEKQQNLKRPKLSSRSTEDRKLKEPSSNLKPASTANHNDDGSKSKTLERCDSTGSLSSLCSQQSQRSSKSSKERKNDSSVGAPDSKRIKTSSSPLLSAKDIKQEKPERPKSHSIVDKNIPIDKKPKSKDKLGLTDVVEQVWDDSQYRLYEDSCKEDSKGKILVSNSNLTEPGNRTLAEWDNFAPEMHKEMKEAPALNKHNPQALVMPMDYYFTEGKKQKLLAEKEKDPFQQAVKFFEAAVLFILTSQQREEYNKDPDSVYQFYSETLKFSYQILSKVKNLQTCPGSTEFKLLILCLKCQSLLSVKLYNLKIKEIKEQLDGVAEFLQLQCPAANPLKLQSHHSRFSSFFNIQSPHSTIPSPASNSQNNSSDRSQSVSVPQNILDTICRQHTHLINLHRGHDLWEQADMYMTRSNLREFFKEVADQLEPLTLHSSITELVKYIQKGISLVKKSLR